jgi:ATP-dependent DNA ligase
MLYRRRGKRCWRSGVSVFELIRFRQHNDAAVLCAFDLIELDGKDLRLSPIEDRKGTLAELLRKKSDGIALNAHYESPGYRQGVQSAGDDPSGS